MIKDGCSRAAVANSQQLERDGLISTVKRRAPKYQESITRRPSFRGPLWVREIPSRLSTLDCELLRVPLPQRTTLYSHEIIDVCASDHYFAHAQAATRALFVRPLAFT